MSGFVLEAEFSPGMPLSECQELARLIESAGFDRLGVSDVVLWPDTFVVQAMCSQVTTRIEIGSMVSNPFTRHPAVLAAAARDIDELSGGRAFIGLGVGAGLDGVGIDVSRPISALRDALTIIRGLLDGERVDHAGRAFSSKGAVLRRPATRRIPIAVGTRSEQVAGLAGELADRALVGARYVSPPLAARYREWVAAGRVRDGRPTEAVEIAPRLTLCCSHDAEAARHTQRWDAACFLVDLRPADLVVEPQRMAAIEAAVATRKGWYFDPDASFPAELDELVTDDIVDRFSISGSPRDTVAQFRRMREMGFDTVSLKLAPVRKPDWTMFDGLVETITSFAEVLPEVKALG
jgi:5,10-methylenetetrahydromethanopterin reductase